MNSLVRGRKRDISQPWLDEKLRPWFSGRVLVVDDAIVERADSVAGASPLNGRTS
jgi:hypothetical protein